MWQQRLQCCAAAKETTALDCHYGQAAVGTTPGHCQPANLGMNVTPDPTGSTTHLIMQGIGIILAAVRVLATFPRLPAVTETDH
jgi:hypothetical protein